MTDSILITGPTGFLGSHLVRRFTDAGKSVIIVAQKGADPWRIEDYIDHIEIFYAEENIEEAFKKNTVTSVINTATLYGRHNELYSEIMEANCIFPLRILEYAARYNTPLFINTDTVLDKNTNAYSRSKKQYTEWFSEFNDSMVIINLCLEHMYGEMDDFSKFIPYIIRELLMNAPEIKLTKGEQLRDFIYIEDVTEAYTSVVAHGRDFKPGTYTYDIGTGKPLSIRQVAETLKELCGNRDTFLNFGALPYRRNELLESKPDVDQFFREFKVQQPIPFLEGIKKTIEWYKTKV